MYNIYYYLPKIYKYNINHSLKFVLKSLQNMVYKEVANGLTDKHVYRDLVEEINEVKDNNIEYLNDFLEYNFCFRIVLNPDLKR